jgi:succinyl-CoA synthetase alpha subunit
MSILVHENTRVVVQGLTGTEGTFHAQRMKEYGTKIVAGVTPGKGGTMHLGVPVFNTVEEAVAQTGADASAIFVPPFSAAEAVMEAADSGVGVIVCITEGIPTFDMIRVKTFLKGRGPSLIGPNTPGIISRSGTLTYEAIQQVTKLGYGQSTAVDQGGDPLHRRRQGDGRRKDGSPGESGCPRGPKPGRNRLDTSKSFEVIDFFMRLQ